MWLVMEAFLPDDFAAILQTYHETEAWLFSHIQDPSGTRFLLNRSPDEIILEHLARRERLTTLLRHLKNPHWRFPSVHIAGTGGKGSVATLLGSILTEMGWKVGVHTSPYVQVAIEKLTINRHLLAPSELVGLVRAFKAPYEPFLQAQPDMRPLYAELWVLLAYFYFHQAQVDWGIVETGMGGRYDATNVLTPELSVITNVDYDHVRELGPTLADIASHKAGIIKPYVPVIVGETKTAPLDVILQEARAACSTVYRLHEDIHYTIVSDDGHGLILDTSTPLGSRYRLKVGLRGRFQAENTALAVSAAEVLSHKRGGELTEACINAALAKVQLPGRLEKVQDAPTVLLDGAHNPQKMQALARALANLYPGKKFTLILGMLATKNIAESVTYLLPQAGPIFATQPDVMGKPFLPAATLHDHLRAISPAHQVYQVEHVQDAIRAALSEAASDDIILITGSIYMLGDARAYWFPTDTVLQVAERAMPITDRIYPSLPE